MQWQWRDSTIASHRRRIAVADSSTKPFPPISIRGWLIPLIRNVTMGAGWTQIVYLSIYENDYRNRFHKQYVENVKSYIFDSIIIISFVIIVE